MSPKCTKLAVSPILLDCIQMLRSNPYSHHNIRFFLRASLSLMLLLPLVSFLSQLLNDSAPTCCLCT